MLLAQCPLRVEEVRPWAPLIRLKVQSREMPPYHYDHDIGIQELKNDWRLSDEDISTIVTWVESGSLWETKKICHLPKNFLLLASGSIRKSWALLITLFIPPNGTFQRTVKIHGGNLEYLQESLKIDVLRPWKLFLLLQL